MPGNSKGPGVESTFFWIAFLRGKEWEFGENERDINERKFDEFYVKKRKNSKIPSLKLVMTC